MKLKLTVFLFCLACEFLPAHEDPHDVIHALTHKLEDAKDVDKPKLHFQRASEYRAIGQTLKARSDLLIYTKLKPDDYLGWLELGDLALTHLDQFLHLKNALELAKNDGQKAKVHFALAEHFYDKQQFDKALLHAEQTIALDGLKQITPILLKSHLLWRLGQLDDRIAFLSLAKKSNPSIVLENAWVDAMIEAGRVEKIEPKIAKEIADTRFKSSWLIRAALCKPKHNVEAQANAKLAIAEIEKRFNDKRPDVTLIMDLARAYLICGEGEKAKQFLKRAKSLPCDPWAMAELEAKF